MPTISVVVPVYKVEPYLRRCVNSILAQTYRNYDLILVDDGSPDNCGAICEEYAKKDPRVHVIHRKNGGLSAARNSGIEWALVNSSSEWITFIDSDDWIYPRYLELLFRAVEETGCGVAIGGLRRTEQDGDLPELPVDIQVQIVETEAFYCRDKLTATVAWGKLFCKLDFTEIRYPEGKIHEDELTTHKILFRYTKIALVDQPLYQYYQNQQGIMRSGWNPKHISEIEGIADQLCLFRELGLKDAAACAARAYLNSIYRNLTLSRKAGAEYASQAAPLHDELRSGLRQYRKLAGFSIQKEPWMFYEAFPVLTLPRRGLAKLRRKRN